MRPVVLCMGVEASRIWWYVAVYRHIIPFMYIAILCNTSINGIQTLLYNTHNHDQSWASLTLAALRRTLGIGSLFPKIHFQVSTDPESTIVPRTLLDSAFVEGTSIQNAIELQTTDWGRSLGSIELINRISERKIAVRFVSHIDFRGDGGSMCYGEEIYECMRWNITRHDIKEHTAIAS